MKKVLSLLLLANLFGCSAQMATTEYLDAAGNVVQRIIEPIADASVQRDKNFHKTIQNRDDERTKVAALPSFETNIVNSKIEIVATDANGKLVSNISITLPMQTIKMYHSVSFDNPLPLKATESEWVGVTKDLAKYTLYGVVGVTGINAFENIVTGAIASTGMTLGSNSTVNYNQSFNSGAGNVSGPQTSSEYIMGE